MEEYMGLLRNAPLVVALALGGCTYVTPDVFSQKVACLDEDGDGAVAKDDCEELAAGEEADCDDSRNDRFPGNPEIPYDGIDQDCTFADLLDIDGDLYPGILETEWAAAHPGISWPANLTCDGDGCNEADDLDCNDNVATTFPGSGAEVPYDGVDGNCGGEDDWDFDRDNHVPPDAVHGGVAYTGTLPQDDCDDTRIDVYPGPQQDLSPAAARQTDVFYDGIDNNCDGANDFDKDGDDYIQDARVTAYLAFLALYEYTDDRPCTATNGTCNDCDDDPSDDSSQPKPAGQMNPGAVEVYYDGADQNCDGLDDYDKDLDGFSCDGSVDTSCTSHVGDDCDDDLANVNPAQLELIDDAVDQDCSGDEDAPHFNFGGLVWVGPSTPDIVRTDEHFVIAAAATSLDRGTGAVGPALSAITITPDQIDGAGAFDKIVQIEPILTPAVGLGPALAMLAEPDVFSVALSTVTASQTKLWIRQLEFLSGSNIYADRLPQRSFAADYVDTSYSGMDIALASDDRVWAVGCSDAHAHLTIVDPADGPGVPTHGTSLTAATGERCWFELTSATAGVLHAYDGATYRKFDLNGTVSSESIALASSQTHATSAFAPNDVRHAGQFVVFARPDTDTVTGGLQPGVTVFNTTNSAVASVVTTTIGTPISADLAVSGGTYFLAAVIDPSVGDNFLALWVGTGPGAMGSPYTIPFEDPNNTVPMGVSLYAEDASTLLIAVNGLTTGTDALGWAFLGVAP